MRRLTRSLLIVAWLISSADGEDDRAKRVAVASTITRTASNQCQFDGKSYPIGAEMPLDESAWYTCDTNGRPTLAGCMYAGEKYRLGQRFETKFFAFRCDRTANSATIIGYACVERYPNGSRSEMAIGRRWLVGASTKNSRYIVQCSSDNAFNIRREAALCFYNTTYGVGVLEGGCMRMVGDVLVQCMPRSKMWPNVRVRVKENPSTSDVSKIEKVGDLKYCSGSALPSDVIL